MITLGGNNRDTQSTKYIPEFRDLHLLKDNYIPPFEFPDRPEGKGTITIDEWAEGCKTFGKQLDSILD